MKKLVFTLIAAFALSASYGQTIDELKAVQATTKDSVTAIQGRVDALQGKIDAFPGWKKGAFGTIGANLAGYNNWFAQSAENNSTGNIGVAINGFANLDREKFFWRNSGNLNLGWVKFDDKDDADDSDEFNISADALTISSLYGYKLSEKFAISALGEYRTTVLDNFNDPGYLDLGVGVTWTPITDLVVVIHPLNYNFVFSSDDAYTFESSLGAKIVVDYTRQLGIINFKTNFSTFQSYKSSDFSNWTWINSFGLPVWKGIGVGLDFGLRSNLQEAINLGGLTENKTQSYWLFGLSYSL